MQVTGYTKYYNKRRRIYKCYINRDIHNIIICLYIVFDAFFGVKV